MSLYGDYDSQNIFAKIIRGEMPCYKLYEDDDVLVFLDLFPQSFGHTLVIPKRAEARNLLEIDADNLTKLTLAVQKVARVQARLAARQAPAAAWLPTWARRPAYAALLGALVLAVSGDGPALRPAVPASPVDSALLK